MLPWQEMNSLSEERERLDKDRAEIEEAKRALLAAVVAEPPSVSQAAMVFSAVDNLTGRRLGVSNSTANTSAAVSSQSSPLRPHFSDPAPAVVSMDGYFSTFSEAGVGAGGGKSTSALGSLQKYVTQRGAGPTMTPPLAAGSAMADPSVFTFSPMTAPPVSLLLNRTALSDSMSLAHTRHFRDCFVTIVERTLVVKDGAAALFKFVSASLAPVLHGCAAHRPAGDLPVTPVAIGTWQPIRCTQTPSTHHRGQ